MDNSKKLILNAQDRQNMCQLIGLQAARIKELETANVELRAKLADRTQAQFNADGEWTRNNRFGIEAYFKRIQGDGE